MKILAAALLVGTLSPIQSAEPEFQVDLIALYLRNAYLERQHEVDVNALVSMRNSTQCWAWRM